MIRLLALPRALLLLFASILPGCCSDKAADAGDNEVFPGAACDGVDNDCDGETDGDP